MKNQQKLPEISQENEEQSTKREKIKYFSVMPCAFSSLQGQRERERERQK